MSAGRHYREGHTGNAPDRHTSDRFFVARAHSRAPPRNNLLHGFWVRMENTQDDSDDDVSDSKMRYMYVYPPHSALAQPLLSGQLLDINVQERSAQPVSSANVLIIKCALHARTREHTRTHASVQRARQHGKQHTHTHTKYTEKKNVSCKWCGFNGGVDELHR